MWERFLFILYFMILSNENCKPLQIIYVTTGGKEDVRDNTGDLNYQPHKQKTSLPKIEHLEKESRRRRQNEPTKNYYNLSKELLIAREKPRLRSKSEVQGLKAKMIKYIQEKVTAAEENRKSLNYIRDEMHDKPAYNIGYLTSMMRRSMITTNELSNLAMKYRDSWKILEQMKIYELLVHTNVDMNGLLKQIKQHHNSNDNCTQF